MMYELCDKNSIPYKRMGKWIVAQNKQQMEVCVPTSGKPMSSHTT